MSYTITEGQRARMRDKIVTGAKKYKNKLIGKDFYIICRDGSDYSVRFFANDFIHLTGVDSDLDEKRFFDNSSLGILASGNILLNQKYNWSTLKGKTDRIENVDQIVYGNTEHSLFVINLHTNTCDYPVAIRNKDINTCIGFKDTIHKARTLRKYSNSADSDSEKEIIAIFGKTQGTVVYDELVYLEDGKLLITQKSDILNKVSDEIKKVIKPNEVENTETSDVVENND